jgi:hypothetical protein
LTCLGVGARLAVRQQETKAGRSCRPRSSAIEALRPHQPRPGLLLLLLLLPGACVEARYSNRPPSAPPALSTCDESSRRGGYVLLKHILGRLHRHGRAAQRALPSIGPYRVVGARAPAALNRAVAGGHFVPRHGHGLEVHCTLHCKTRMRLRGAGERLVGMKGCLRRRS